MSPPLKSAVYTGVISELFGQMVPLTARSHPKNDAIEGFSRINPTAPSLWRGVMDGNEFGEFLPKFV